MDFLEFNDVTFTYPIIEGDLDSQENQIIPKPVFEHFSGKLPGGSFVSLVGQNGCGKTTFLMLASGRLIPNSGEVKLLGQTPAKLDQESKNLLASVIYQNMEFESEQKVGELLATVYSRGSLKGNAKALQSNTDFLSELIDVFELSKLLERPLTHLSKGEIQRLILSFSLLYGSASIFMDEPMFAMEERQKEKSLSYLKEFTKKTGTTIYCSMHELELSKKYADNVLLFYPNRDMSFGTPKEILTPTELEKAYQIPAQMLKNKESLTREQLRAISEQYKRQ
ncbi:ATP-binding cassette domain-containing protein [Treponema pectinovorum]|uniref:ATP-binding cassette domain-containing protein n=1 Tax=Treponema pectinovorum TaxID=164 RepID=UPI0011CC4B4C|nr:ABC transporter ATP-binding protein [Treponema pectinovorum]